MSKPSLENSSGLQSVQAENKHLKNLLNKFVDSNCNLVPNGTLLADSVAGLLRHAEDVNSTLQSCLKLIGDNYQADRVSFFSLDGKNNSFALQHHWASQQVQEYHKNDLKITADENPLNHPNIGLCFASSNLKSDLHPSLYDKFHMFSTASLLMVTLQFGSHFKGMLVLECCTFRRQWYLFEAEEIERTAHLLSASLDALWHKNRVAGMAHLNARQNHILQIIKGNKRTKKAVNTILKTIGSELGLKSIYIIDRVTYSNVHELSWIDDPDREDELLSNQDLEKLNLDTTRESAHYFDSASLLSYGINVRQETALMLISPLNISNEFSGWLIGEFSTHKEYEPSDLTLFWEPIGLSLSEMLNNTKKEKEHNVRYSELLIQNKELALNEMLLRKMIDSASPALLISSNREVKYASQSACSLLGFQPHELEKLNVNNIIHRDSLPKFEQTVTNLAQGNDYTGSMGLYHKNGHQLQVEMEGTLIDFNNQSYCYFILNNAANENKKSQAATSHMGAWDALAQHSSDVILQLNPQAQIQYFNQAFLDSLKLNNTETKVLGNTLDDLATLDGVFARSWTNAVEEVFLSGKAISLPHDINHHPEGFCFNWTMAPYTNSQNEVESVWAIGRKPAQTESLEKELTLAKEKAEKSDKLKSEFLSNISHELRTPLNAIVGFSTLLKDGQLPSSEMDAYIDVIQKNSNNLLELIGNIIDVAKIKSGTISVVKQKVDVGELLKELNNYFKDKVEVEHKGRVKLNCTIPQGGPYTLISDPAHLRQVLVNLIGNAMKFTIKGFIDFGFTVEDEGYRFFVHDTGIGISKSKQQVIFQPFNKSQDNNDRLYGGIGIGLAICERLVDALGGKIGLISEVSKGSEFFFIHPLHSISDNPVEKKQVFNISSPVIQKNYHWPNKMMLLVDENSSTQLQVRKFVENTGITLISARTTAGASTLLMNRKDIHLVLMDMPFIESEATALLQIIKQLDKNMPVILHADKALDSENQNSPYDSFDAFLAKPTQKDELLKLIDQFLVK